MSSSNCAVSVVYDMFKPMPDSWYNQERIKLFYTMVDTALKFDEESGQPDCEDPEKAKVADHIKELEKELNKQDVQSD